MEELNKNEREVIQKYFSNGIWHFDEVTNSLKLRIKIINKSTNIDPQYTKSGDSGFDLRANLSEPVTIGPNKHILIPTGLFFEIPVGYELQVRSRSGLAIKNGIMVLNSPGTVDANYRGEVMVILKNTSDVEFTVNHSDRIAQGVITPIQSANTLHFEFVDKLSDTERGDGGFGSSGVK